MVGNTFSSIFNLQFYNIFKNYGFNFQVFQLFAILKYKYH